MKGGPPKTFARWDGALLPLSALVTAALTAAAPLGCSRSSVASSPTDPPPASESAPAGSQAQPASQEGPRPVFRPSPNTLAELLAYEDTDGDRRITVRDHGARRFLLRPAGNGTEGSAPVGGVLIEGTYPLANLVQELFLARREGRDTFQLEHLFEPPLTRLSRQIQGRYWDALTRQIEEPWLSRVLSDTKLDSRREVVRPDEPWPDSCTPPPNQELPQFLYVPAADPAAFEHYARQRGRHPALVVCRLPERITPDWVASLSPTPEHGTRHGLLALARGPSGQGLPYVVPGGRFNELYGWDSYFHVLGLLADRKAALARDIVDNQLYEVHHYGKVLNANRTYYLTRGQPPLLSASVRALWTAKVVDDLDWLKAAMRDVAEEYWHFWGKAPRKSPLCARARAEEVCLSTYGGDGLGEPPEVEPGHYDWLYTKLAQRTGGDPRLLRERYQRRELPRATLQELDRFFLHDRAMRESGHDTTYRFWTESGDSCADFATIDLNALLFKVELDLAFFAREAGDSPAQQRYCSRAQLRRQLVQTYLWNGELFVDFRLQRRQDGQLLPRGERSSRVSATTLYPLWASLDSPCQTPHGAPLALLDREQAQKLVAAALRELGTPGGLSATSRTSLAALENSAPDRPRQWDYPFGWAPHQILAWQGLRGFGFDEEANRLTYRWLYTLLRSVHDYHGTVPEKFDVVRRSHEVVAEYGNVGTDFSYVSEEGFGWMNASLELGRQTLPAPWLSRLTELQAPEDL